MWTSASCLAAYASAVTRCARPPSAPAQLDGGRARPIVPGARAVAVRRACLVGSPCHPWRVEQQTSAPRVVVIDDHPIFRNALRELLTEHGIPVVGEAAEGEQGVVLVEELAPDLAVMDISMPGISGIEATRRIRARCPATRVLVLTVSPDPETVTEAVAAGACGYLLKDAEPADIVMGIRFASAGGSLLSAPVAAGLLERVSVPSEPAIPDEVRTRLSERELEVLRLLAQGKENAEIAEELVISPQTVKNHVSSLLAKLEVENRLQAAVAAVRGRLV